MLLSLSRLLCALPHRVAIGLATPLGWLWFYLLPIRRRVALQGVDRVFGDSLSRAAKRRIVRRAFVQLCCYVIEGLRMPALTPKRSLQLVSRPHKHRIDALLARRRGVIAVTAHFGNYDFLGTSQAVLGYRVHAIVKEIRWPAAYAFMQRVRHATGLQTVAPRRSRNQIKEILRRGEIVAFLIDQHLPPHRAIVCEFFGQLAATTPAPVQLAFETGAPIMPMFMVRGESPGTHVAVMEPEFVLEEPFADREANVRHNTERLNRLLEGYIRAHPDHWLWLHRRWKVHDDPRGWKVPPRLQHLVRT